MGSLNHCDHLDVQAKKGKCETRVSCLEEELLTCLFTMIIYPQVQNCSEILHLIL